MARQVLTHQGFYRSKTATSHPDAANDETTKPGSPRASSGVAVTGLSPVQAAPPHGFTGEHPTQNADPGGIPSHVALYQLPELAEGPSTSRVALRWLAIAGDTTAAASQEGRPEEHIGELQLLRRENAVLRTAEVPPTTSSGTTTPRLLARPSMAQRPQTTGSSHQPRLREACPLSWQWSLSTPRTEPVTAPSATRATKAWIEAARAAKEEQSEEEGLGETETPDDSGKGSETTDETDSEVPSPFPSRGNEDSTEEYPWTESGIGDGRATPPLAAQAATPPPEARATTPPPEPRADAPPPEARAATPPPEARATTPPPEARAAMPGQATPSPEPGSDTQPEDDDLSLWLSGPEAQELSELFEELPTLANIQEERDWVEAPEVWRVETPGHPTGECQPAGVDSGTQDPGD
ncbi:nascent polypeptide-associated complex subunit alpha, muscle-specific form-like [Drosophila obscura]|uniref:nascent polypeptide-associated complex subunit alpha, muscle-specific form-like n=1 Tax=Drosophila obscura TaxID=7282 RepID=UPI001BB15FDA|nr:nascent polypeptide-associated complex subunit alpha, muscle-specific form-like [Drosophila obscura]